MEWAELQEWADQARQKRKNIRVYCCTSTGCQASNSPAVKKAMDKAVKEANLGTEVQVVSVGCMGFCGQGPIVEVENSQDPNHYRLYEQVTPEQAPSIIKGLQGEIVTATPGNPNHPFFAHQLQIVREHSGQIDPESIEEYLAVGGYQGLHHSLFEMSPEEVVQEITRSGLRGRGGAGFPTGLKWSTVAKMPPGQKYVICNADEGDPGAFMDRSVLESDPHRIIEGMAIAGYAVGADHGYIYVRAEYPLAISRLEKAIKQAKRNNVLGTQIFGSAINFSVEIRVGAGAFVCGEETALIASVSGGRGVPRPRPPYPAVVGLYGKPTLINNVETLGNIAPIITKGADWYASIGTGKSKGTKIFSLTGNVIYNGLIEVPMGITLREIVEEMGGGVPNGGQVKAVQTGGPSGGCIPADQLDISVDYESLSAAGSMMGSGGMVVMDQDTSMVGVAKYYMEFCQEESCGKCIPCRAGTVQMYDLLKKLLAEEATAADLAQLQELCDMVKATSLCGLGQTSPNPVLSTLRYFESEYQDLLQPAMSKV
ncbi:MAG: NADH-quinone oxidoreductase subunit L [Cyanobacteria bacterium]|jgi:bidirectional [NiFe] hydrogenase diaphorase subunit|nr:NADH-quinone oxidoreductase subunit L [Cyanobacteria bacterium GSL.Bin1]